MNVFNDGSISPNQLTLAVNKAQLDAESARSLQQSFSAMFEQAETWREKALAIHVTDAAQKDEIEAARKTRLQLKSIRVEAEKTRKKLKEDSLRKGKAIDGIANVLKFLIEPAEEHLLEQEKFVQRQEEERLGKLQQEREDALMPFEEPGSLGMGDLSRMSEEQFAALLEGTKARFEKRREDAIKAEEERVARERAEAVERERIRIENELLRAEAAAAEEKRRAEREKAAAELAELEEVARMEREAAAAVAERERARVAELEAQQEAARRVELQRLAEESAAHAKAVAAPDREKLKALIEAQRNLPHPDLASGRAQALGVEYLRRHADLLQWLEGEIATL